MANFKCGFPATQLKKKIKNYAKKNMQIIMQKEPASRPSGQPIVCSNTHRFSPCGRGGGDLMECIRSGIGIPFGLGGGGLQQPVEGRRGLPLHKVGDGSTGT